MSVVATRQGQPRRRYKEERYDETTNPEIREFGNLNGTGTVGRIIRRDEADARANIQRQKRLLGEAQAMFMAPGGTKALGAATSEYVHTALAHMGILRRQFVRVLSIVRAIRVLRIHCQEQTDRVGELAH